MQKKYKILGISLILCCVLLLGALVATVLVSRSRTSALTLLKDGKSAYVILYGTADALQPEQTERQAEINNECARNFSDRIRALTGAYVQVFSDRTYDAHKKAIVFGATDIEGGFTAQEIAALEANEIRIRSRGDVVFVAFAETYTGKFAGTQLLKEYDTKTHTLRIARDVAFSSYAPENTDISDKEGEILFTPIVFAVGTDYQIVFLSNYPGTASVRIGETSYYDETSGLKNSDTVIHKVTVPQAALDEAKAYQVKFQIVYDRKPYYPAFGAAVQQNYTFRPVDLSDGLQCYTLTDTHIETQARMEQCVSAASYYGDKTDLLIHCGDAVSDMASMDRYATIIELLSRASRGGSIPVIYARGNHECRGEAAEYFVDYMPSEQDRTFYTFRVGPIWGVVLDCGEDNVDSFQEYGGTVAFDRMHAEQTEFLRSVIAAEEYAAPDVEYRIGVCHFAMMTRTQGNFPEFDTWRSLLSQIPFDIMLGGHSHLTRFYEPGTYMDNAVPYPCVIAGTFDETSYTSTAVEISDRSCSVSFVRNDLEVVETKRFMLRR